MQVRLGLDLPPHSVLYTRAGAIESPTRDGCLDGQLVRALRGDVTQMCDVLHVVWAARSAESRGKHFIQCSASCSLAEVKLKRTCASAELHRGSSRELLLHCGGCTRRRKPQWPRRAWSNSHSHYLPDSRSHRPHHCCWAGRKPRCRVQLPAWLRWWRLKRRLHCWHSIANYCGRCAILS